MNRNCSLFEKIALDVIRFMILNKLKIEMKLSDFSFDTPLSYFAELLM